MSIHLKLCQCLGLFLTSSPKTDPFRLHPHRAKSFFITMQNRDAGQLITLIHHSHADTSTPQERPQTELQQHILTRSRLRCSDNVFRNAELD